MFKWNFLKYFSIVNERASGDHNLCHAYVTDKIVTTWTVNQKKFLDLVQAEVKLIMHSWHALISKLLNIDFKTATEMQSRGKDRPAKISISWPWSVVGSGSRSTCWDCWPPRPKRRHRGRHCRHRDRHIRCTFPGGTTHSRHHRHRTWCKLLLNRGIS